MLCDPERRRQDFAERGMDPERLLTEGIDIINSVADVAGVRLRAASLPRQQQGLLRRRGRLRGGREAGVHARAQLLALSCWSTTTGGRVRSSRCAIFRPTRASCSVLSRPSRHRARAGRGNREAHRRGQPLLPARAARAIDPVRLRHGVGRQSDTGIDRGDKLRLVAEHRASGMALVSRGPGRQSRRKTNQVSCANMHARKFSIANATDE